MLTQSWAAGEGHLVRASKARAKPSLEATQWWSAAGAQGPRCGTCLKGNETDCHVLGSKSVGCGERRRVCSPPNFSWDLALEPAARLGNPVWESPYGVGACSVWVSPSTWQTTKNHWTHSSQEILPLSSTSKSQILAPVSHMRPCLKSI